MKEVIIRTVTRDPGTNLITGVIEIVKTADEISRDLADELENAADVETDPELLRLLKETAADLRAGRVSDITVDAAGRPWKLELR